MMMLTPTKATSPPMMSTLSGTTLSIFQPHNIERANKYSSVSRVNTAKVSRL